MSTNLNICIHILTLLVFGSIFAASDTPQAGPKLKQTPRLLNPVISDEGKVYICVEMELLVFESNGTITDKIHLNYTCNTAISPVLAGSRNIFLIADNRLVKVSVSNTQPTEYWSEVLLGPHPGLKSHEEIIGLSVSLSTSCVIVNIIRTGLFGFKYDGTLKWSMAPVLTRRGYLQGCRRNVTGCYFVSSPVIDHCDNSLYITNNQGELYSMSLHIPQFKWIKDFSSLDNDFTVTPGDNGQVYVTVPTRSVILALDVLTGNVIWQNTIGPLSSRDSAPVVDINGYISIGTLDCFLNMISPSGEVRKLRQRKYRDAVIQVNPVLDCSGYAVYISLTQLEGKISLNYGGNTYVTAIKPIETIFSLVVPAKRRVYWSESYPGAVSTLYHESDLRNYVVDAKVLLAFLSASSTGNSLPCFTKRNNLVPYYYYRSDNHVVIIFKSLTGQRLESSCSMTDLKKVSIYTGNEKVITLFVVYETIVLIILLVLVRFCCVFWRKKKLKNQDLGKFLEKRNSLRLQKKVVDRTITELEKKTAEGSSTNEMLEKLGDLVEERDVIKRKLSTTYSLGKDAGNRQSESLIPLSDKKAQSLSFKSGKKESDTSSGNESNNEEKTGLKGKALMEPESSSDDEEIVEAQGVNVKGEGDDQQSGGSNMRKRPIFLSRNAGNK